MPRRGVDRSWGDLRLGIVVTAVASLVTISIFLLGSTAGPLKPEIHPYVIEVDDAAGIRVGSIVRVGGLAAGEVLDIVIVPPADTAGLSPLGPGDTLPLPAAFTGDADVRITLGIEESFIDNVTASSRAQLAILGVGAERYVKVTAGDVRERPLEPGSMIPTIASVDWDLVLGRLARAFNESQEIMALTDELRVKLATERGSLGRLISPERELPGQIRTLERETASLLDLIDQGPGFVGLYGRDRALQARVDSLAANVEAIRAAADDPQGGVRPWSERAELEAALADLRAEVAQLDASLADGRGSLGRFLNDQELWIQVRLLTSRVGELAAAFKANPMGFINIEIF